MANILISYISILGKVKNYSEKASFSVTGTDYCIYGMQTNEAGLKYVMKHLYDNGQQLDKMVCLCSKDVLEKKEAVTIDDKQYKFTAIEYLEKIISKKAGEELGYDKPAVQFVKINIDDFESGLSKIMSEFKSDDNVYIDTTGGFRDAVIYIQLIMNILGCKNVNIRKMLYSEIGSGEIRDMSDLNSYYSILDGVNQFATSGKADILKREFYDQGCKQMSDVINNMGRFAEALQLCDTSELDKILDDLNDAIAAMKMFRNAKGIVSVFQNVLPAVENKFVRANDNYCTIIKWCLDNGLIQQALTLYIEKIPEYLIRKKILTYKDNKYTDDDFKGSMNIRNKEAAIFYEKFMELNSSKTNPVLIEARTVLEKYKDGIRMKSENPKINEIVEQLDEIKCQKKDITSYAEKYFMKYYKSENSRTSDGSTPSNGCCNKNSIEYKLVKFIYLNGYKKYGSMINELIENKPYIANTEEKKKYLTGNEGKILDDILNLEPSVNPDTLTKKFNSAENLDESSVIRSDFRVNIPIDDMKKVMLDYIYAKVTRNQINHASDEEILTENHKKKLEGYFADYRESKVEEITRNLKNAVMFIENLKISK